MSQTSHFPCQDDATPQRASGAGTVIRRRALTRAEELAIISGDWLHQVSALEFESSHQLIRQLVNSTFDWAQVDDRASLRYQIDATI